MKVLVIGVNYAPEPTGIAPYTTAMCSGLVARGHRVQVITAVPHYPEWRVRAGYEKWVSREVIDGVPVRRLRHYVPARPSGVRRLLSEVTFGARVALTRWGRPDVVVFVSPALFSSAIAMIRSRLFRIPSAVWLQDIYSLGVVETAGQSSAGVVARVVTAVESWVLSVADGVCVIHDRFAIVAKQLGALPAGLSVVRNWTHVSAAPDTDVDAVRAELGWAKGLVVALHTGAMGQKQDLDNVIAAARLAADRGSPVRFVLMGDGGERTRLEMNAADVANIEFMDPLPREMYPLALRAADVLVVNEHAGLRDMAVPSKLTSYFSSGRPVVAATDPESVTASEIGGSGAGVGVPAGDPGALLDAVLDLHADPARSAELGRRGLQYRTSVLSEDAAIGRFTEWLSKVTRSRRAPRALHEVREASS